MGWQDGRVTLTTGPRYAAQLDYPLLHRGKVRELYRYDDDRLLMVATDQISAFDYVLDSTIPDKGAVLTQLSQWWFGRLGDIVDNHVLPTDVPEQVRGRAVICERLEMIPVECVARGYLTGSGWLEYQQSRSVCGVTHSTGTISSRSQMTARPRTEPGTSVDSTWLSTTSLSRPNHHCDSWVSTAPLSGMVLSST